MNYRQRPPQMPRYAPPRRRGGCSSTAAILALLIIALAVVLAVWFQLPKKENSITVIEPDMKAWSAKETAETSEWIAQATAIADEQGDGWYQQQPPQSQSGPQRDLDFGYRCMGMGGTYERIRGICQMPSASLQQQMDMCMQIGGAPERRHDDNFQPNPDWIDCHETGPRMKAPGSSL